MWVEPFQRFGDRMGIDVRCETDFPSSAAAAQCLHRQAWSPVAAANAQVHHVAIQIQRIRLVDEIRQPSALRLDDGRHCRWRLRRAQRGVPGGPVFRPVDVFALEQPVAQSIEILLLQQRLAGPGEFAGVQLRAQVDIDVCRVNDAKGVGLESRRTHGVRELLPCRCLGQCAHGGRRMVRKEGERAGRAV